MRARKVVLHSATSSESQLSFNQSGSTAIEDRSFYFYSSKRGECNMSGHYRQTAAARQEDQSTAESDIVSAKEPQCGRWGGRESLWMKARHPGRGTGDSPHMQAAASTTPKV